MPGGISLDDVVAAGAGDTNPESARCVWLSQLNPWFAAAWVGFLVTGLNMMPVGQLDGGHVTHCLFGRYAYWIAEGVIVFAIAFMVWRGIPHLAIMVLLLLVMGTRHPPTRDDRVPLGPWRYATGDWHRCRFPCSVFLPISFRLPSERFSPWAVAGSASPQLARDPQKPPCFARIESLGYIASLLFTADLFARPGGRNSILRGDR